MRAAIYSRFSTDRQNESSIADQERICVEYAARQGWQVTERYRDEGISGAAWENRPGVVKMKEAALARRFDVLLVTDLSRLSRSTGHLNTEIDRFVARGIRIIGVQDGYDSGRKGHKLQAGLSGIIGEAFREMVKDRTYAALESRAKDKKATGGRAYGYRDGVIVEDEAAIVREIFERFGNGESCRAIAADFNRRGVASPGSTWKRSTRRCAGWMGSAVRVILRNERYRGAIHWNTSEWRKDPDTGKRTRVMRPRSEWISHADESLRIVSVALWDRAQLRNKPVLAQKYVARGKAKYLVSGLMVCGVCSSHYVIAGAGKYQCSGWVNGRACTNSEVLRLDLANERILGPIRTVMLAPDRITSMAKKLQTAYAAHQRAVTARQHEAPKAVQELDGRIARLRERLRAGDPDMEAADIQGAIEAAERKRQALLDEQPAAKEGMRILTMLPKAAELCRQQIQNGLEGDEREAAKARITLKAMLGGAVRLLPGERAGELWAESGNHPAALLKSTAVGCCGSGGRIWNHRK